MEHAPRTAFSASLRCPYCRSVAWHRVPRRLHERVATLLSAKRPFRCDACDRRFWTVPPRETP